jgi:hypothetical protein
MKPKLHSMEDPTKIADELFKRFKRIGRKDLSSDRKTGVNEDECIL